MKAVRQLVPLALLGLARCGNDYEPTRRFKVIVIPTLVFFDTAGREVGRHHGFPEETKVAQILNDLGAR